MIASVLGEIRSSLSGVFTAILWLVTTFKVVFQKLQDHTASQSRRPQTSSLLAPVQFMYYFRIVKARRSCGWGNKKYI
jgi:hypothetical protein